MNLKIGWLAKSNPDWNIGNPRAMFSERSLRSRPEDVHLTPSQIYGVLPQTEYMERTGNHVVLNLTGSDTMKHVEPDDFIIHLRSFQGGIEHSQFVGKVSNAYCVLTPGGNIEPRYYKWVLKSSGFIQELSSTTDQLRDGQSIKYEQFAGIGLPFPPIEYQRKIADHLDALIIRIDTVLSKIDSQIQYLREFKASLITSAVTGALQNHDGDTSRETILSRQPRDFSTGSEVSVFDFYNFPRAWKKETFRWIFENRRTLTSEPLPLLGANLLLGVTERYEGDGRPAASEDLSKYKLVEPGDIIMNPLGKPHGSIGRSDKRGITSPAYWVLRLKDGRHDSHFMHYLLRSEMLINEFKRRSKNLPPNQFDLPWEQFRDFEIPLPPRHEQKMIAKYLDTHITKVDSLISLKQQQIENVRKYRSSLVNSIVIGELPIHSESDHEL